MMATLLVTAFGAFPGAPRNPSADVLKLLTRNWRGRFARAHVRLAAHVLPVVHDVAPHLDALARAERPDAVVHLGLAARRRRISVETRARNAASVLKPDASGRFAAVRGMAAGAPASLRSGWNCRRLVAALHARGVDADLSNDAGDYVCNAALWRSLESGRAPAVFIHLPHGRRVAPEKLAAALAHILPAMASHLARARPQRETT